MKKSFRVLVTAGDTYESVDEVRRITHMATGRLGSLIADEFASQGAVVTLLCGERSLRPALPMENIVQITGVVALQNAMHELLLNNEFDCVVHSMAVSDYTVRGLTTEENIVREITKGVIGLTSENDNAYIESKVKQILNDALYKASGKISSEYSSIAIFMDRAPKVISLVKQMQPNAILVGFKLLTDVSEQELLEAVQTQMQASGSDFVLANDLSAIDGDRHGSMLVGKDGILDRPKTKQEIAKSIVSHVMKVQ